MDKKIKIALLVVIVIAIAAIAYGGISANEPSSKKIGRAHV